MTKSAQCAASAAENVPFEKLKEIEFFLDYLMWPYLLSQPNQAAELEDRMGQLAILKRIYLRMMAG